MVTMCSDIPWLSQLQYGSAVAGWGQTRVVPQLQGTDKNSIRMIKCFTNLAQGQQPQLYELNCAHRS